MQNNEQAVLIAAGDKYNLAIGMSSKVYSWGNDNNGQLGNGNDDRSATGIDTVKYKDGTDVEGAVGISTHGNTAYIYLQTVQLQYLEKNTIIKITHQSFQV